MEHSLELQKFHYFDEGNTYAGQKTKDPDSGLLLRYLVEPDKEAALLRAYAWTEDCASSGPTTSCKKEGPPFPRRAWSKPWPGWRSSTPAL